MTTSEILQDALLKGKHLTKFDFLNMTNSVCLAQRVLELRQMGWGILDKAVKGKGNLREYWLEPAEIERIKKKSSIVAKNEQNNSDEELPIEKENIAETPQKVAQIEEQMGLGLPWQ